MHLNIDKEPYFLGFFFYTFFQYIKEITLWRKIL